MRRAHYSIVQDHGPFGPLVIRDLGPWEKYMTITNDAENVVAELHSLGHIPPGRNLLYYDSLGTLDELNHDGNGHFLGFAPGPGRKRNE